MKHIDLLRAAKDASPLHLFVQDHCEGLRHAAALLGGADAVRRVAGLLEHLSTERTPSRRALRLAEATLALLRLENVADPERIEAACFAAIDPADPVVEDICLLCDGLDKALKAQKEQATSGRASPALAA